MRLTNKIVFASTNRDKFEEYRGLLSPHSEIQLIPAEDVMRNAQKLGFVETGDNYLENALAKARLANHGSHYPSLADDSGLEVEALGGRPGARSHRYAVPKAGITQDQANVEKLLDELKGRPMAQRSARFVTCVALVIEGILLHATGTLEGTIAEAPMGSNGFGYDPIFIPKGATKTLAQMTLDEKNALSHRGRALQDLLNQARGSGIVFAKP